MWHTGLVEGVIRAKQPYVITEAQFERLARDPANNKIKVEELRAGLAAERAGLIDPVTHRGIPGQAAEAGFEFTTRSGARYDVKAFRADSLADPRKAAEFALKFNAAPEVKILLDPRGLTDAELATVIDRAVAAGVDRSRFVTVPRPFLDAPINVGGTLR